MCIRDRDKSSSIESVRASFVDICGTFPTSGRRRIKYVLIIMDSFIRFTKLYHITKPDTHIIVKIIKKNNK